MTKAYQTDLASIIEQFPTFSEILDFTSDQYPDQIFLIEGDDQFSYREFNELVNRACYYFESLGLASEDIISFILRNSVDFLILYFAAIRSRIILNPFPFHLSGSEVLEKIESIDPKYIFCHKSHSKSLSNPLYKVVDLDSISESSFSDFLSQYSKSSYLARKTEKDQTAVFYYSSGTTGKPKIIDYTHRSMVLMQASMLRSNFIAPGARHLCVLPLGHTASLRYTVKPCICTGSTMVLYESFWKLRSNLWQEVEKYQPDFMGVVPTILIAILNTPYPDFQKEQASSMQFIGCGSSFLSKNLQDAFEEKFGIPVANIYGLSETGATHFDDPRIPGRTTGNLGKPFDIIDVKIFDDDRNEVGPDELGEIGMKGPSLLKDYYKNTELYTQCFHDGYFLTGDLGKIDRHGIHHYIDRKKDLIIKGGVNIVPTQIEETILSHQAVQEVAVFGKPDILLGETIKCCIVIKQGEKIDSKTLQLFCKENLGDFKTPSEVEFVDELPKGPSGKILKRQLRDQEFLNIQK